MSILKRILRWVFAKAYPLCDDAGALHRAIWCLDAGLGGKWLLITEHELDVLRAMSVNNAELRQALLRARDWGVSSWGYSARESKELAAWIDTGMRGPIPELPEYMQGLKP